RGSAPRRSATGPRRELPLPVRTPAVGGDPDRAVPPGHRHALAGAAQSGSAPTGLLRGGVDHLDLRLVRGERALLSRPPARDDRGGSGGRTGGGPDAAPTGTAAPQRHDLPVEPPDLRRHGRAPALACGEPR